MNTCISPIQHFGNPASVLTVHAFPMGSNNQLLIRVAYIFILLKYFYFNIYNNIDKSISLVSDITLTFIIIIIVGFI